jgi:hypothetical protein
MLMVITLRFILICNTRKRDDYNMQYLDPV